MSDYPIHHHPIPNPFRGRRDRNRNTHQQPQSGSNSNPNLKNERSRARDRGPVPWRSWLYQTTFGFWIALIIVLLGGSAWGLSEQAIRGGRTRWNIFLILAAYVFLFFISVAHLVSRRLSIKRIMRTMPKPYVPTKAIDLPNAVADHIMVEYSRTAVIAHISQATKGYQEGWGRPGTKWENQHFRTYILSTIPKIQKALPPSSASASARPINPTTLPDFSNSTSDKGLQLFLRSYAAIVEKARYARREPTEEEAMACEKVVEMVLLTMEMKKLRERTESRGHVEGG